MKRAAICMLGAALLAGCASTPTEIRSLGAVASGNLPGEPEEVAACLLPHLDEIQWAFGYSGLSTPRATNGGTTIFGNATGAPTWVIDIAPSQPGRSTVHAYVSDQIPLYRTTIANGVRSAVAACA